MSSKRELYKAKSRGRLGSRDARARLKAQESKSGREALLSSKRRIPLSSIQEEEPSRKKGEQVHVLPLSLWRLFCCVLTLPSLYLTPPLSFPLPPLSPFAAFPHLPLSSPTHTLTHPHTHTHNHSSTVPFSLQMSCPRENFVFRN